MFLINLDFERYFFEATTLKTVGYLVRGLILFLVGGFIAYLHEDERKKITLFLLGVAAPSMIAGYISTSNQSSTTTSTGRPERSSAILFFIASANAQQDPQSDDIKKFTLPPQSGASQFFDGLLGTTPKNVWFVIAGSYLDLKNAKNQAEHFNTTFKAFRAQVYAPYGDNPYYAVVIGSHLTQHEARKLRDRAVAAGFPKDSYFKTFPALPPAS
jgi:hypothetical protein